MKTRKGRLLNVGKFSQHHALIRVSALRGRETSMAYAALERVGCYRLFTDEFTLLFISSDSAVFQPDRLRVALISGV